MRTIAIGLSADPGQGRVDMFLLPGESAPPPREGLTVFAPKDLPGALHLLRHLFADHAEILTLAQTAVVGDHPWTTAVESRLAEFINDLGNSTTDCWVGALNAIRNGPRLKGAPTTDQLRGLLAGRPAICLAAGPSATPEAIGRIRELRRTHFVFCAEVMLGACLKAGFAPDFVTMLERPPAMHKFVRGLGADTTLIAAAVVDPGCVAEFPRVVWWRGGDRFYDWLCPTDSVPVMAGRSTGVLSVAAALLSGCNPVYLVGHDLAYGPDATSHSGGVHPEAPALLAEAEQREPDCYGRRRFEAPGWSGQGVQTNGFWNLFRGDISTIAADFPDRTVISAQGGAGAAIAGVTAGELPAIRRHTPPIYRPTVPGSAMVDPTDRLPSILADIDSIEAAATAGIAALAQPNPDLAALSESFALSTVVSHANAPLFQYMFQALFHSLQLRLLWRGPEVHRECLRLLAVTLLASCGRIREDLAHVR